MAEVTFSINYQTELGQYLCISGAIPELGKWDESEAISLSTTDNQVWTGHNISLDQQHKDFSYYYLVKNHQGVVIRKEWKRMHRLIIQDSSQSVYIHDNWIDRPKKSPFYSSAYYDVLFAHRTQPLISSNIARGSKCLTFQTYAPTVPKNKQLYLLGSIDRLGAWTPQQALPMSYIGRGLWYGSIELEEIDLGSLNLEFKHFIADSHKQGIRWEAGDNHVFSFAPLAQYDEICLGGMFFDEDHYAPRFAGAVCPLFSMRAPDDFGIGDFGVLKHAVDWAHQASLHVLQLLPINDTTFYRDKRDSYPYNAISVDAIHPIYIDLQALPKLKDKKLQQELELEAQRLRQSATVMYPEVLALKERYFRQHFNEYGVTTLETKGFKDFVQDNQSWLYPYAAFCILRDRYPNKSFGEWGEYALYDTHKVMDLLEHPATKSETAYQLYLQYTLAQQLLDVCAYAEKKGVLLKGDLPIGVAPHSLEVWVNPELFNTDRSAGAPPDAFATDGQNWGFPTYNWERMYADDLQWWRNRFSRMSSYFKAFRIDHILGFFRIWEVPKYQKSGLLGHFSPALPLEIGAWAEQLGDVKNKEILIFPSLTKIDANKIFGSYLESLLEQQYLLSIEGEENYYRLSHGRQQDWLSLEPQISLGGRETLQKLSELCKEIAFVQDISNSELYHPRISFEQTNLFASWSIERQDRWREISQTFFYETHNELWRHTAYRRLTPLLECTDMLVCAEDLGMIPATVPEVLNKLEILSLDLERMPKMITSNGWMSLKELHYNSICTTSTHDMPPLRLWWKQLGEAQGIYLAEQLPERTLTVDSAQENIFASIVSAHIMSPAMFVILPIQDWMSINAELHLQEPEEEQINHPEDANQYWNYRLPIDMIEAQTKYKHWTQGIRYMLQVVNRE